MAWENWTNFKNWVAAFVADLVGGFEWRQVPVKKLIKPTPGLTIVPTSKRSKPVIFFVGTDAPTLSQLGCPSSHNVSAKSVFNQVECNSGVSANPTPL